MTDLSTKALRQPVSTAVALAVMGSVTLIVAAFWYVRSLPNQPPPLVLSETDLQQMAIDPSLDRSDDDTDASGPMNTDPTSDLTRTVARFGDMSAHAERTSRVSTLTLVRGSSSQILASSTNAQGIRNITFGGLSFSPRGGYLLYHRIGWEWSSQIVYDIAAAKTAITVDSGEGQFTENEALFYTCFINHFGGEREAAIYRVPQFTATIDLYEQHPELQDYFSVECREDRQNDVFVFDFSGLQKNDGSPMQNDVHRIFKADLSTGVLLPL